MKIEKPYHSKHCCAYRAQTGCHTRCIRNSRRVFRLPRLFNKDASASRFVNPKINSAQTNPRGKSKEGGRSPLLGRFKGVCKGGKSKSPLCWFPFHRQRPFPLTSKEKGAEYRPYGSIPFEAKLTPSAHPKSYFPSGNATPRSSQTRRKISSAMPRRSAHSRCSDGKTSSCIPRIIQPIIRPKHSSR